MANLNNTTSDQKNVSQDDSASSTDSCALHINLSNEESITNTKPNITKQLPYDTSDSDTENDTIQQMQVDHSEDEDTKHQCIKTYSLKLPHVTELIEQSEAEQGNPNNTQVKDQRIKRKEEFAKAVLHSPLDSRHHTIEREKQHKQNEMNNTQYGYYNIGTDNLPFVDTVELLKATVTHVKQKRIEAFDKTANGMFIIVLTSDDFKTIYPQELNFREQVQNVILNFRILQKSPSTKGPNRQGTKGSKYDDTVFVVMYLTTTISNAAVIKDFMEFGEVHTVFPGRYKEE